jgi:hypothetical protein
VGYIVGQATDSVGLERVRELKENRGDVFGSRLEGYANYLFAAVEASPIGLGTGATSLGTRYVAGGQIPLFVEVPAAKVIGDLSLVGLAVYLWLFATMCTSTLRAHARASRARSGAAASLLAALLAIQLLSVSSGYELAVAAILLWFLSGMAVALERFVETPEEEWPMVARPAEWRLASNPAAALSAWGSGSARTGRPMGARQGGWGTRAWDARANALNAPIDGQGAM